MVEPAVRFLGPGASRNGPFGVLGLSVRSVTEPEVLDAVHNAMGLIDAHPEARTPAASEARLAVHAAAANLLDRAVLAELLMRLRPDGSQAEPARRATGRPAGAPAAGTPGSSAGLGADLLRCIAAEGGWSRHAMDRYLKVAHAKGHASTEAVRAIEHIVGRSGGSAPAVQQVAAVPAVEPMARPSTHQTVGAEPVPRSRSDEGGQTESPEAAAPEAAGGLTPVGAAVLIVALFVLMGVAAWAVLAAMEPAGQAPENGSAEVVPRQTAPVEQEQPSEPTVAEPAANTKRPLDNGPAITHQLEFATEGLGLDTEGAIADFEEAVGAMSGRWVEISLADRLAAQDQIVGFLYRVSGQSALTARAFDAIEAGAVAVDQPGVPGPSDITRGVWSMGTLVRLRREQNLPSTALRRIDRAMLRGPDGLGPNAATFRAGAVSALRSIADRLAAGGGGAAVRPSIDAWNAWARAARAATAGDGALLDSAVISAAEAVLRVQPEPGTDVAGLLVETLSWRAGGAARAWLLRAFADRSLDSADLHALTLAVATRSGADGIDPSMVLPRGAGGSERRALGERYRAVWGLDAGADQDTSIAVFLGAVADDLRERPSEDGRDEVDVLASIVRTARLNAAGALLWRADAAAATDLLGAVDAPIDSVRRASGVPDAGSLFAAKMGTWAESYIDAGAHIPRRLTLLNALAARGGRLEPMEAAVVVNEALRGSPQKVRDAAAAVVEGSAPQPVVVNALLESLPMMPRTDRNARLVEIVSGVSLPDPDMPSYPIDARRALVERLLEVIAGHGIYARLDALAGLLREAYSTRLHGPAAGVGPGASASQPRSAAMPAAQSARVLADRWAIDASARAPSGIGGLGLDEIERRRAARRSMTSGLVQEFHAEQLALFELMAHVVSAEQPDRANAIRSLVEEVARERAAARDVLIQIELVERAMLDLWRHRFGEVAG